MHIPSGQILQRAPTLIFRFNPHRPAQVGRQTRVRANAGLNARFFIAADDKVICPKRLTLPPARVQIQNRRSFGPKVTIARENPVAIAPRLDGIVLEETPDGGGTHGAWPDEVHPAGDIGGGLPTQGLLRLRHQLTRRRFEPGVLEGGKSQACDRDPAYHRVRNRH